MNENTQSLYGFKEHPARAIALGELHERPALLLPESALALRYVFTFDEAYAKTDWSQFEKLPLFKSANRMNAYNTYLLMERAAP